VLAVMMVLLADRWFNVFARPIAARSRAFRSEE
jgi:hypothetical protein